MINIWKFLLNSLIAITCCGMTVLFCILWIADNEYSSKAPIWFVAFIIIPTYMAAVFFLIQKSPAAAVGASGGSALAGLLSNTFLIGRVLFEGGGRFAHSFKFLAISLIFVNIFQLALWISGCITYRKEWRKIMSWFGAATGYMLLGVAVFIVVGLIFKSY